MYILPLVLRALLQVLDPPRAELPAPGSLTRSAPARETVVILLIITISVLWLLAHHYSVAAALAVTGGIGLISAELAVWLARVQPTTP
jgi:hypothetical protein